MRETVFGAEPQPLHHSRPEPLDQSVGVFDEAQRQCFPLGALEIERHGRSVSQQQVIAQLALETELARLRPVDAQYRSAQIGKQHRAHRRRPNAGEFHDLNAGQWSQIRLLSQTALSVRGLN